MTYRKSFTFANNSKNIPPKITTMRIAKPDARQLTYSGDYLDRHSNRFKGSAEKAFIPRTKKRQATSYLSKSRHYAPPVRIPKKKSNDEDEKEYSSDSDHEISIAPSYNK